MYEMEEAGKAKQGTRNRRRHRDRHKAQAPHTTGKLVQRRQGSGPQATGCSTRETWVAGVFFRLANQLKRDLFRGAVHAVTLATCP